MKTSEFDYELPAERIAQTPIEPRDASRLMVIDRSSGRIEHIRFREIGRFLSSQDLLVINRTRVFPARLFGHKEPSGGRVELLLLRSSKPNIWEALVGGKRVDPGQQMVFKNGLRGEIIEALGGPRRLVRFSEPVLDRLEDLGVVPLPPYIKAQLEDPERYQTVFAEQVGSAAAPTAGLHFTEALLKSLNRSGVQITEITLHIGLDTFAPVVEDRPEAHEIHSEWCKVGGETAEAVNETLLRGGRVVAVGTTSVRALETAASSTQGKGVIEPFEGWTDLYILPGYAFKVVSGIITNFHLPKSTLLMMIAAFWERQLLLQAYETAMQKRYRFYSFGDAMFIK